MKPKARKAQAHAARRQRHETKRRDARKAGKLGRIGPDSLLLTPRHSMVPLRARKGKVRGIGSLILAGLSMSAAWNVLKMPDRVRQKVA